MKKTSKPSGKACQPAQEECGVWLDPVQLKVKLKQNQRIQRPISKLLNPSIGGGGYNLAVALNFTQTRTPMPNTKQSSISSFFTPQSRVLNKTAASELATRDAVDSSTSSSSSTSTRIASTSPAAPVELTVAKRIEHELDPEVLAFLNREEEHPVRSAEPPVHVVEHRGEAAHRHRHRWERDGVTENNEAPDSLSHEHRGDIHSLGRDSDHGREDRELETKRLSETFSSLPTQREPGGDREPCTQEHPGRAPTQEHPGRAPSQEHPGRALSQALTAHNQRIRYDHRLTQHSGSQFSLTHQEHHHPTAPEEEEAVSGTALLHSLQSEEGFRVCLGAGERRTSTQKERGGEGRTSTQKERGGEGRTSTQKERGGEGRTSTQKERGGEGRTSTQKPRGSHKDEEKENDRSSPSALKSPNKCLSLSPPRRPLGNRVLAQTTAWSAPPPGRPWKRPREDDGDNHSHSCKRPRARSSPLKKAPPPALQRGWRREEEMEESLAALFTQDSEGFRVIAHRGAAAARSPARRGPLKDHHSNLSHGAEKRTLSVNTSEEEEEEEILFTQDSQGNRVIKH